MLSERQEKILEFIIIDYVKNIHPVGSNFICEKINCSSATVRNEMKFLEDNGYLEKEHISSGRIPSQKGYRYYVDNLMKLEEIGKEDLLKLQCIFKNNNLPTTDYIKKSLEIVSELTNYTMVILGNKSGLHNLKKLEVIPIEDSKILAIIITDKGLVENKKIFIEGVAIEEIEKTVAIINKILIGTPICQINQKLEYEVKPIINISIKQHDAIYSAFYEAFDNIIYKDVSVVGKNNILNLPEFNNVEKVRDLFKKLDSENILKDVEEKDGNINIYIGSENDIDDDVTIIKTNFKTNEEEGTIAIVGPKRMEYERVIKMFEYIKENIENN